ASRPPPPAPRLGGLAGRPPGCRAPPGSVVRWFPAWCSLWWWAGVVGPALSGIVPSKTSIEWCAIPLHCAYSPSFQGCSMDKIARATLHPLRSLNLLSQEEIGALSTSRRDLFRLFRDCALAILNTDSNKDDAEQIFAAYADFDIQLVPQPRGLKLEIFNAPAQSFVDGTMIRGIQDHLFSALRDIVYTDYKILGRGQEQPQS